MKKCILLFLLAIATGFCQGAKFYVTSVADTGAGTLRQAILDANANAGNDTIMFDGSTNGLQINIIADLNITDSLVIDGNGQGITQIVDDGSGYTFAAATNVHATFRDLSISNGGSAIYTTIPAGNIDIINCRIFNMDSTAINFYSNYGNLLIDSCYIHDNDAGVYINKDCDLVVTNSTFINNSNTGAIMFQDNHMGHLTLTNNTINKNTYGIRICDSQWGFSTVFIINNTIYGNTNYGIDIKELFSYAGEIVLANNISYNNNIDFYMFDSQGFGANPTHYRNIIGTSNSLYGSPAWYSSVDPVLDTAGAVNNGGVVPTIALTFASLNAINNADTLYAPITDQRGYLRSGNPDIGAFEYIATYASITETACNSYISPSGNYTWITSGIYNDTIPNSFHCDSIITIDLTVYEADTGVVQVGLQLISNAIGAAYQWLDCNNAFAPISGETGPSFTAPANGSYAVEVTENGCVDTSVCVDIYTVGMNETNKVEGVIIYPNPARDQITLSVNAELLGSSFTVSDMVGRKILAGFISSKLTMLAIAELAKGVYLLNLEGQDQLTFKVIKK